MRDRVDPQERFEMNLIRQGMKNPKKFMGESLSLVGITKISKNGEVILHEPNTIATNLKSYFQASMDSVVDYALNSLFSDDEIGTGGAQDGNDGIAFEDSGAAAYLSTNTSAITATQTYGKRWKGVLNATTNHAVDNAHLGYNYGGGSPFAQPYASQSFSTVNLVNGDVLEAEWEIYIV